MKQQNQYSYQDLLDCAEGKMFGPGNAKLPAPPMLMFDRITSITAEGGLFNKGEILAELDIKDNLWFFECHFLGTSYPRFESAFQFKFSCDINRFHQNIFLGHRLWNGS